MGIYRAQVVVPASNGVNKDAVVNNWGFYSLDSAAAVATAITAPLRVFYDSWNTYRSTLYTWASTRMKLYHMDDPIPRVPVADTLLGCSASAPINTLPTEVSLCLSMQAARVSGQSQRRRRGRIYLGPFSTVAADTSAGRPSSTMRTLLAASAETFRTTMGATTVSWSVISQPKPGDPMTHANIVGGWIDDAWDTQRRRGSQPTARLIWGV